jgi:hypothetical protein
MKQHEVGLHIRARPLTHDVQRMQEYIVIGKLTTQALKQMSLRLHMKALRNGIGNTTCHSLLIAINKGWARSTGYTEGKAN